MVLLKEQTADSVVWKLPAAYRNRLLNEAGLRLDDWLRAGQARLIKHGPHRSVYHVSLPGLDFHLKHYRIGNLRDRLRQLIRPAKARTEYARTLAVAGRGIPTFSPLGFGECHAGPAAGESYLLTRTLADTLPLDRFINQTLPAFPPLRLARVRQRLAMALGRLVRQMHDAGVQHNDLHAGNLLVRLDARDRAELYLIDLHAARLGRPLSERARRRNLIMLNRWFIVRASASDRLRFWRAYANKTPGRLDSGDIRELEQQTWTSYRDFWRRRDRRCLGTNKYFERVRRGGVGGLVTAHVSRELDKDERDRLLTDPDEPFQRPGVRLLKDSRSSTVAELEVVVNGVVRRVVYKRFRVTAWSDPLANLCRPTPALRSWVLGHGLCDRGLPTARPYAVLHRQRAGMIYEGYLLTEKIESCVDLHGFLAGLDAHKAADSRAYLRDRVEQVARLVRDMHRRHLSHRDLKAANILTVPPGQPAPGYGSWLIDLVGVRRCGDLSRARRVRNLARLNASFLESAWITRTERLRFLRVYLQWGYVGRQGWKRWWREIEEATQAKVLRNLQSGRPLA